MEIKKAVIPVAGKGTRFLPATKEIPKEMIPIIDRPMIHYAVEEAIRSGITEIIFVVSPGKESIENYFKRNFILEEFLENKGDESLLNEIKNIGSMISIKTIEQKEQLGLGHAVLCAEELVAGEDFAVILGDDLILSDIPVTKQLLKVYASCPEESVIGVMEVPREKTKSYGIIDGKIKGSDPRLLRMSSMVEKPVPKDSPSNLATPGRYVLKNEIFNALKNIKRGSGGEYQLTDAINLLALDNKVLAYIFEGDRFDTGNIEGHLNAIVEFSLRNEKYHDIMKNIIKDKIKRYDLQ